MVIRLPPSGLGGGRLHGVNRSGAEYACVQGWGFFDGPTDEASLLAMKSWSHITAVRVPVNEACWNAESYVNATYAGANYINAGVPAVRPLRHRTGNRSA